MTEYKRLWIELARDFSSFAKQTAMAILDFIGVEIEEVETLG